MCVYLCIYIHILFVNIYTNIILICFQFEIYALNGYEQKTFGYWTPMMDLRNLVLDIQSCFLRFVVFWVCYQVQIPNTCIHIFFIYIIYIVLCNVDTLAFGVNPSSILDSTLAAFEEKFIPTKHRMTWQSSLIWRWMEQSLGHWQKDRIFLVDHALR